MLHVLCFLYHFLTGDAFPRLCLWQLMLLSGIHNGELINLNLRILTGLENDHDYLVLYYYFYLKI